VNFATYASRNLLRRKGRTILTIIGVAVVVLIFIFLRTALGSFYVGIDNASKDRLGTRHKVSFIMPLPKRYVDDVKRIPGVKQASFANWFGGKDPKDENNFFATLAVDHETFLDVYDEVHVDPGVKEAWQADRSGAIIGDLLAKKLGVKVGDKMTLRGTIFPGDWQFNIVGIYTPTRKSMDRFSFFFRWDMLNDDPRFARNKDMVGWIVARIDQPSRSADISALIDKQFEDRDVQTISMSEKGLQMSFMAMFSSWLTAISVFSVVLLGIMMLLLGNTIAMGVRERTHEYGVLRAVGFQPKHIFGFIIGEGIFTGLLGGLAGLVFSWLLINFVMGPALEAAGPMLPYFKVNAFIALLAIALAIGGGLLAALIPGIRASRLPVTSALRRVD
jgi:putative ABC transport system permease protein